jgi:hypothetical protein
VSSVKEEGALFHLPRSILVRLSSELLPSELEVGSQPTYVEIQSDIFMIICAITGGDPTEETGGGEAVGIQR